jgi:hypothetical protein
MQFDFSRQRSRFPLQVRRPAGAASRAVVDNPRKADGTPAVDL